MRTNWEVRDDLLDNMRDAVIKAANSSGRRPRLNRLDFERALDLVLDQVLAMAGPRLERDWNGSEVVQELKRWRSK